MNTLTVLIVLAAILICSASIPYLHRNPKELLVLWLMAGLFVPYWIGVQLGGQFLPAIFVLTLACVAIAARQGVKLRIIDAMVVGLTFTSIVLATAGMAEMGHAVAICGGWAAPYLLGRWLAVGIAPNMICRILAVTGCMLALQSTVEFVLDWHPFTTLVNLPGPADVWAPLKYRAGYVRSEGALGHPIALGNTIAMTLPFIMYVSVRSITKVFAIALCLTGIVLTFSRNAVVAAILAVALSALFSRRQQLSSKARVSVLACSAGLVILSPLYIALLSDGTDDLQNSTEYRTKFISVLADVKWFGIADIYTEYAPGKWGWESPEYAGNVIVTLDNTILLHGLRFGWVATALLVAILLLPLRWLIRSRGNPALIAVVSQLPTIFTVAMITQFAYVFWFVLGVAVSAHFAQIQASSHGSIRGIGRPASGSGHSTGSTARTESANINGHVAHGGAN